MSGLLPLKILSIVMTAGFGIVGLLGDFRDKRTQKIRTTGWVSLAGIILGAALGGVIEWKEAKELEGAKREAAQQTLELAKKADKSLDAIQRLLTPIEEPAAVATFHVNCDADHSISDYCDSQLHPEAPLPIKDDFKNWPASAFDRFSVSFLFFRDAIAVSQSSAISWRQPDWSFSLVTAVDPTEEQQKAGVSAVYPMMASDSELKVSVNGGKPIWSQANGTFRSSRDFPGSTVLIEINENEFRYLKLERFEIDFKDGESIACNGPYRLVSFAKQGHEWHAFLYTFPKASVLSRKCVE